MFRFLLLFVLTMSYAMATPWYVARFDYSDNTKEVASFVNLDHGLQLQNVVCTKGLPYNHRFTILLPDDNSAQGLYELKLVSDGMHYIVYAEVANSRLDIDVDQIFLSSLEHTPEFKLIFNAQDAQKLHLPQVLTIKANLAYESTHKAASICSQLCIESDFSCNQAMIASLLYKQERKSPSITSIEQHCVAMNFDIYSFDYSKDCTKAIDAYLSSTKREDLSFIKDLFFKQDGHYARYKELFNQAVKQKGKNYSKALVDDREWYLMLFAMLSDLKLSDYPNSYYKIKDFNDDRITLIFDIEKRYELEYLKYKAVLLRHNSGNILLRQNFVKALNEYNLFYQQFNSYLPYMPRMQALRPLIYKLMLQRLWYVADKPQGFKLAPKGAKRDPYAKLEDLCSNLSSGGKERFIMVGTECFKQIELMLYEQGLRNYRYEELKQSFQAYNDLLLSFDLDNKSAIKQDLLNSLGLSLITLHKAYNFADYFVFNDCVRSEDSDICNYALQQAQEEYRVINNGYKSLVGNANKVNFIKVSKAFNRYHQSLQQYLKELTRSSKIAHHQMYLSQALSLDMQNYLLVDLSGKEHATSNDD